MFDREAALTYLNQVMAKDPRPPNSTPELLPSFHVVGLPRAGTTLATQLIANSLHVRYFSNAIAQFWEDPVVGAALFEGVLGFAKPVDLASQLGRTTEPEAPHEAGRFWRSVLGYAANGLGEAHRVSSPDWVRLRSVICEMQHLTEGMPFMAKNFLWLDLGPGLLANIPNSYIIVVERDPLQIAASLYHARMQATDPMQWIGPRPAQRTSHLANVMDQVAFQVAQLEAARVALRSIMSERIVGFPYARLVNHPHELVDYVSATSQNHGVAVEPRFPPPEQLVFRQADRELNSADRKSLRAALRNEGMTV